MNSLGVGALAPTLRSTKNWALAPEESPFFLQTLFGPTTLLLV